LQKEVLDLKIDDKSKNLLVIPEIFNRIEDVKKKSVKIILANF
jgi:hypothetical protein